MPRIIPVMNAACSESLPSLKEVAAKVYDGRRLDAPDGLTLISTADIHTLGELANLVRRRIHRHVAYYNVNRHINYTNVCVLKCRFCSFARAPRAEGGYELSLEKLSDIASAAATGGATELHLTGGLHPYWKIDRYQQMLAVLRQAAPALHIKAFTAVEIAHIAALSRISIEQTLRLLIDAGLDSLPGGGAEIFDPSIQSQAFAGKMGEHDWFSVHRQAHRLGLKSNATMLYGHIETPAQRVAHLLKLRDLQDETHGLQCLVPLGFHPEGTALAAQHDLPGPTGLDDLRTLATARLLLDNVPHIKSFWVMQSIKLAQIALSFGADDIDGTVQWYDITKSADQGNHQHVSVDQLRRLIIETGHIPMERDSLYRAITRRDDGWQVVELPAKA